MSGVRNRSRDQIDRIREQADLPQLVEADGIKLRRSGREHRGLCPFHDDRNPSLTLYEKDGRWAFRCYGCQASGDAIDWVQRRRGIGFEEAATLLEGSHDTRPNSTASGASARSAGGGARKSYATEEECLQTIRSWFDGNGRETLLPYRDPSGSTVGYCLRIDWAGEHRRKEIRYCWRDGDRWITGRPERALTLFGLERLLAIESGVPVFVTEGELKASVAADRCGLVTVSAPYGAGKASLTDWSALQGRSVIILPDHDQPGERHASQVADCCLQAGAREIRIARLAEFWTDLPQGGDIADLIASRPDPEVLSRELVDWAMRGDLIDDSQGQEEPPVLPSQAFQPYPIDALPPPLEEFVRAAADSFGVDGSLVSLPLLSGLASAIGNTHLLEAKGGGRPWRFPSILWTMVVAAQGSGKTPCQKAALAALEHRESQLRDTYEEQLREYEPLDREAKARALDSQPVRPTESRVLASDATIEAVAVMLQQNPRGMLIRRDELKAWFGGFDQYRSSRVGSDAQQWCELWNGGSLSVDRRSRDRVYVDRSSLSVTGGIQPELFRRVASTEHRESGLLSRFLVASPPKRPLIWTDKEIPSEVSERVDRIFEKLFALEPEIDADGSSRPRVLRFDEGGLAAFRAHHDAFRIEELDLPEFLAGVWSKLVDHLARLALVLHLVRVASGDRTLDPGLVDARTVASAAQIIRWHGREASRLEDRREASAASDSERNQLDLIERIRNHGGEATPKQARAWFGRLRATGAAERALEELVKRGFGRWLDLPSKPKGGRPSRVFRLNEVSVPEATRVEL